MDTLARELPPGDMDSGILAIPVLIVYGTVAVDEGGQVYFFDDIYRHDADLEKALAKGYPYP